MKKSNFTLIELLVLIAIILIVIGAITLAITVPMSNCWYTNNGVLKQIKNNNPKVVQIVEDHRNVFGYSTFVTKDAEGNRATYRLDTNILFNYKIKKSE